MRLIHIVENLDKGAVENWLVNVFIESRQFRPAWDWTFYCILGEPGRLDEKVRNAGGKIIYSPVSISQKRAFLKHLRNVLVNGKFDIIHAHHDFLSGFYMLAASGVRGRKLIHVHNNDEGIPVGNKWLRKILLPVFRSFAFWLADDILSISENTRDEFRKGYTGKKPVFRVIYYGIPMDKFDAPADRAGFRIANSLPGDSKVLLYTGRMIREKNPVFVVDILNELLSIRNDVFAVFVGKGDLEEQVHQRAKELDIEHHVRLAGWKDNIAGIMKSSDIMVFPRLESPKEGLGLVIVESQCAGLPVFTTHGIVNDAIVLEEMVFFLELSDPHIWAIKIDALLNKGVPANREESLGKMKKSRFEITQSTKNLISIYESEN